MQQADATRHGSAATLEVVEGTPYTPAELLRYTDRLLDAAHVKEGDVVALRIQDPAQLSAIKAMSEMAFRRGAYVEVLVDEHATRREVDDLVDRNAVFLSLNTTPTSQPEPIDQKLLEKAAMIGFGTLDVLDRSDSEFDKIPDPDQIFEPEDAFAGYREAYADGSARWNVAMWPSEGWAQKVYPELSPDQAYRALGEDLLNCARAGKGDTASSWREHVEALHRRAETINELDIDHLHIEGGGTDIKMALAEGSEVLPCDMKTINGDQTCVNTPTEEVFGTPNPASVEGVVKAKKPLQLGTETFTGIELEFRGGHLVSVRCDGNDEFSAEENAAWLKQELFDPERGMDRLGELGLVDQSSRVARSGRTFYNTIMDENAGFHLALGSTYEAYTGGQGNQAAGDPARGLPGHVDICCGNDETRVTAVTKDGREVVIMDKGLWQI